MAEQRQVVHCVSMADTSEGRRLELKGYRIVRPDEFLVACAKAAAR